VNAKMVLALTMGLAAATLPLLASESRQDGPVGAIAPPSVDSRLDADPAGSQAAPAVGAMPSAPSVSNAGSVFSQQIAGEPSVPSAFLCTGLLGLIAHYLRVRRI